MGNSLMCQCQDDETYEEEKTELDFLNTVKLESKEISLELKYITKKLTLSTIETLKGVSNKQRCIFPSHYSKDTEDFMFYTKLLDLLQDFINILDTQIRTILSIQRLANKADKKMKFKESKNFNKFYIMI